MDNAAVLQSLCSLTYGLYVVTSHHDGKLNGQIANTVFQVTAEPPRVAVSINKENLTHAYISQSGVFAVSILDEPTPIAFIGLFGYRSGRDVDKLSRVTFKMGASGCPIVTENTISVFEVRVRQQVEVGTHTIFLGDVTGGEVLQEERPLTCAFYRDYKKGKHPKSAPTYTPPVEAQARERRAEERMKYVCDVCGYVYDPAAGDPDNGVAPGTAFEDVPDDWVCPVCGVGKDQFSPES